MDAFLLYMALRGRVWDAVIASDNEAVDGDVDILLVCDLARLGRDLDRTLQYWYLLRDLDVSVHTANSGEVDLSVAAMLRKIIEQ